MSRYTDRYRKFDLRNCAGGRFRSTSVADTVLSVSGKSSSTTLMLVACSDRSTATKLLSKENSYVLSSGCGSPFVNTKLWLVPSAAISTFIEKLEADRPLI